MSIEILLVLKVLGLMLNIGSLEVPCEAVSTISTKCCSEQKKAILPSFGVTLDSSVARTCDRKS
jgi:hypothetical protein